MAIRYSNMGIAKADDERMCLGLGNGYAYMVNADFTVNAVKIFNVNFDREDSLEDFDYRMAVEVDADPETVQNVRARNIADLIAEGRGLSVSEHAWRGIKAGDVVEVVKGRKYKAGTIITVKETYECRDCYGRLLADYILGIDGERVSIENCTIWKVGNGSLPEAGIGDKVIVTKDIINPTTNEVRYAKGTVVEVARFEVTEYGKRREYVIGTKGERLFRPFTKLFV